MRTGVEGGRKDRTPSATRAALTLAALALAAAPAMALDNQTTAKTYSDRLAALPEIKRFAALRRAVLDFGPACQKVLAAGHQGPWKNLEMWVVRCATPPAAGRPAVSPPVTDYGAFIGPDGSVQISTCADVVKVQLPACRRL